MPDRVPPPPPAPQPTCPSRAYFAPCDLSFGLPSREWAAWFLCDLSTKCGSRPTWTRSVFTWRNIKKLHFKENILLHNRMILNNRILKRGVYTWRYNVLLQVRTAVASPQWLQNRPKQKLWRRSPALCFNKRSRCCKLSLQNYWVYLLIFLSLISSSVMCASRLLAGLS